MMPVGFIQQLDSQICCMIPMTCKVSCFQIFLSIAMFDSSGVLLLMDQSIYINISKLHQA